MIVGFLLFSLSAYSKGYIRRTNNFQSYKDLTNEFGYAFNLSYLKYENLISPQLQLRYSKRMSDFLFLGVGYGGIFTENYLSVVNLEIAFHPSNRLSVFFKPGLIVHDKEGEMIPYYLFGIGSRYLFEISEDLSFGPMVELDVIQNETNYQIGFCIAMAF